MKILLLLVLVAVSSAEHSYLHQLYSRRNKEFAVKIYKETTKIRSGNFFVCPFSLETILAITGSGARGDTAREIFRSVTLPENHKPVEDIYKSIIPAIRGNNSNFYNLDISNKVYIQDGFQVMDKFKQTAADTFASEVEEIDFVEDTRESIREINKWVNYNSHHRLFDTVDEQVITPESRLVLINALYLGAFWQAPFHASKCAIFYTKGQYAVEDHIMAVTAIFKYYECSKLHAKFLEMEYEGGDISMTIVLPNERTGLENLEGRLLEVFEDRKFTKMWVNVQIPSFRIVSLIDFNPIMEDLGMKKAFNEEEADFSGINGNRNLHVSTIIQKSVIDISEAGTGVIVNPVDIPVGVSNLPFSYSKLKLFHAKHPFLFIIKKKDVILVVGRYQEP